MKKRNLLRLHGALFLMILFMSTANAQTFIASFGVQHNWGVPHRVSHYIDDHYYDYNWVHVRKVEHHGSVNFEIVLQRGNIFLEVTLDPFGHVYKTVRREHSPLYAHECASHCGYHSNYYKAYLVTLNRHSHYYGRVNHFHKPKRYAYGRYNNSNNYHVNHYTKGYKNEHRKEHKTLNGKSPHNGESYDGNRGNGKSGGSRDGFSRGAGRNGSGKSKNNGRKASATASRRPQ